MVLWEQTFKIIFKNKHYYSFLLEFKYVEIDFDLFQEAITFKTTKSSLENCILFYFLNIFKSYLSFFIITLLSFIRKILIPFDFDSNTKFHTNLFLVGRKKKSYQCFSVGRKKNFFPMFSGWFRHWLTTFPMEPHI